jgi:hypothetical protein
LWGFSYYNCEQGRLQKIIQTWPVSKRPNYVVRDTDLIGLKV